MKGRIHRALGTAAAGLAACALLAGGVQAADRPDDQAGAIGVGGVSLNVPSDVVDRAIARHVAASAPSDVVERAVARRSATALRDRGTPESVRPDDRPGTRGVGLAAGATQATVAVESGDSFEWGDAAFGAAATFALIVLLGGLAAATFRHRGRALAR